MTARSLAANLMGLITALAVASVALTGCGRAEEARQPAGTQAKAKVKGRTRGMTVVEMASASNRWSLHLADNPATRDFVALLPLKLTLKNYAGTEKIADLPRKLSQKGAPAATTPVKGDVTFYAPWGNLAIFYKNGHHSPGLIPLGRIEGDLAGLDSDGDLAVVIRLPAEHH